LTHLEHVSLHGHRVALRTAGEGPLVVLLHGMAGESAAWLPVMPALARRFTVIAPDLLGHGDSAKPPGEYSISAHANFVRDLLAVLGHERATLVGQSFGGGVAMQLAYQFPERCERLVLVSSGGLGREVAPLLRWLSLPGAEHVLPLVCTRGLRDAGSRVAAWLARAGLRAAPATAEMWRSYASLAEPETRRAFFRTLRAVVDAGGQTVSATDRLYLAAHVPTLIVWGEQDALIPVAHAHAAHAAIPGSRLAIFPDTGHFPHCEAPERFAETLIEFIDATAAPVTSEESWREALRRGSTRRAASSSLEGDLP
jgi:pimeloyl-ACP methyl ester carboxylesterase